MNQALLSGIASKAYDKLLKAAESKQPIAVTGLPDTMAGVYRVKTLRRYGQESPADFRQRPQSGARRRGRPAVAGNGCGVSAGGRN